jgi:hypothetical protein
MEVIALRGEIKVLQIILFLICFFGIYFYANNILDTKYTDDNSIAINNFYNLENNSTDVIFFGNSLSIININPVILWEEEGIPSYTLGTGAQPFWVTYFLMKETFKYQSPGIIVLETYIIINGQTYTHNAYTATGPLRMSKNKMDAIMASDSPSGLLLGFPVYHARRNLTREDFIIKRYDNTSGPRKMNGFHYTNHIEPFERPRFQYTPDVISEIPETQLENLMKIIKFVKEQNTVLLLLESPHAVQFSQDQYNFIKKIAAENNINYIDYNVLSEEINIDYQTDFADWIHLNYHGAAKLSKHLGRYLHDVYGLEDKRNDGAYASWNVWAEECMGVLEETENSPAR